MDGACLFEVYHYHVLFDKWFRILRQAEDFSFHFSDIYVYFFTQYIYSLPSAIWGTVYSKPECLVYTHHTPS